MMAPSIREQLAARGVRVDGKVMARWQACARSLCMVRVHRLIPDAATRRGEERLCRRILHWCLEHKKLIPVEKST
jgi:hypothetical protein